MIRRIMKIIRELSCKRFFQFSYIRLPLITRKRKIYCWEELKNKTTHTGLFNSKVYITSARHGIVSLRADEI